VTDIPTSSLDRKAILPEIVNEAQLQKDKLVYSTDRDTNSDLEMIRLRIERAGDRRDVRAYERILRDDLELDPASQSFRERVASFRRACNLDD